ncbi:MAG: alpha-glucosidase [Anaerolineae bacterium]|nr:alpha-glucosidase [Anaerolineae bacterium]
MNALKDLKWWQTAVFYQIYPRSFADGNGDGIGDFKGIIDRLDYLQDLGIDAIWLSPHYPSPQFDCGYDIADYTGVAPEYGTLDDFKQFLKEAHRRDLRVILDLVLNHTSDQHPWFIESRSSRHNPKRDWYVWHDPAPDGGPPNNWHAIFSDSAWEYDAATGQYYYHLFFAEQPDLNWRNPEVKQAMFDAVRFWLDLGVDGFRIDAIGGVFEDPALPNHTVDLTPHDLFKAILAFYPNPPDSKTLVYVRQNYNRMLQYQMDQPELHELLQELRAVVDEYPDRVLVGETEDVSYYGDDNNELHMVFNFPLMNTAPLTPPAIRANQKERLSVLPPGAWPCNTLGNHDTARLHNRCGDGKHDAALARVHLALMLTLRGTPFLYNGEEIGMRDGPLMQLNGFRDNVALWTHQIAINSLSTDPEKALHLAHDRSRDKSRTPMQWANTANAGFCPPQVRPWLPVNPNYAQGVNVADQMQDPSSLFHFYRRILRLRRKTPALIAGDYQPLHHTSTHYLAFLRQSQEQTCLVILNMSAQTCALSFDLGVDTIHRLFSNKPRHRRYEDPSLLIIDPFEIYIGELENNQ